MGGMRSGAMGMRGGRGSMGPSPMMGVPMGNIGMGGMGTAMGAMGMGIPQMGMQGTHYFVKPRRCLKSSNNPELSPKDHIRQR